MIAAALALLAQPVSARPVAAGPATARPAVAHTVTAVRAPAPALPARPRPPATEPAGWRPEFATDFSGGDLPAGCVPYDGPQGGETASYFHSDEVGVSDGVLHLSMRRREVGGRPFTSGGLGCRGLVQTYGRYEFRARSPIGAGIDSFVTLWPAEAGNDKDATLVEILSRPGAGKAYLTNQYGVGTTQVIVPGDYSGDFHTYTIEWAPTFFRVLIDGVPRLTDTHVSSKAKWIGFALSTGDKLTGVPDRATPLPADFQVDWLRVYSYDPLAGPTDVGAADGGRGPATDGRLVVAALVPAGIVATFGLLVVWYTRVRTRRRLHPAHRA
jgi:beta-glucanase (GH16 family)